MADHDDDYFVFTSKAIPSDSFAKDRDPFKYETYSQFFPEELAGMDFEGVPIKVDHVEKDDAEREIPPFGSIIESMKSKNESIYAVSELDPIPAEIRATPEGKKRADLRRRLIELIKNGSFRDVSVRHDNEYELVDGSKIKCTKKVKEMSLTEEGGRPGSNVVEYKYMPTSLRRTKGYRTPSSLMHIDVNRDQLAFIPKEVKANIKNFEELERQFGSDIKKQTTHEMSTQAPVQAPAPAPAAPVQAPAPGPIQPGSDTASAYINALADMKMKMDEKDKEIEKLKKEQEKASETMKQIEQTKMGELKKNVLDTYTSTVDNTTAVLNEIKDVDPDAAKKIGEIEASKAKDMEIINSAYRTADDASNTHAFLTAMKAAENQVYAYNSRSKVLAMRRTTEILNEQKKDISSVLGKHALGLPSLEPAPVAAPAAAPASAPSVSLTPMGTSDHFQALLEGLRSLPNPKKSRFE